MKPTLVMRQNIYVFLMILGTVAFFSAFYVWRHPEWVFYRAAENNFQAKNWQEAAVFYEKSLEKGVKDPYVYLNLTNAYMQLKQYPQAKKSIKSFLEIYPDDINGLKSYAAILTSEGEFGEAEKIYQRLLKNEKKNE